MNVQNEERVEASFERQMRGDEWEIVEDSFDKIKEQYLENWQLFVMRVSEWERERERERDKEFVGEKYSN